MNTVRQEGEILLTGRGPRILDSAFVAIALGLAFIFDDRIALEFSKSEHAMIVNIARLLTQVAVAGYWFAAAAIFAVVFHRRLSTVSESQRRRRLLSLRYWAFNLFAALVVSGLLTLILKFMVGRGRPSSLLADYQFTFKPGSLSMSDQSFPSGHSQVIFCVSTLVGRLWPRRRWLLISFAAIIAITRVIVVKHFLSDVIAGAWVGVYGSYLSLYLMNRWFPLALRDNP